MATAADQLGGLDTLVISAGVIHIKPLAEVTEADWDLTLDVNLKGAFLIDLVESVAVELAEAGVTVNAVCPVGTPTTGMGRQVIDFKAGATGRDPSDIVAAAAKTNPLGRNATEADVASAVLLFLSDEAAFLTGVALDVDGGAHLGFLPGT